MHAQVQSFFDKATSTFTYVVHGGAGSAAAVIDPVLDYDHKAGRTRTTSNDAVIAYLRENRLELEWILETHAHADHLSGAAMLRDALGGRIAIGRQIGTVQRTFKEIFNLEAELPVDGSQFDHLFGDDETFQVGKLSGRVLAVPGHTPACVAYLIEDLLFVGDTMFMPDVGSARCDFPGGDARTLYRSVRRLLSLPDATRIMVCHDYPPAGREPRCETTVAEQRASNMHVHDGISEEAFVEMRTARDRTLEMPVLIIPSIQVNIRAGRMPPAERNGRTYLKIPLNVL